MKGKVLASSLLVMMLWGLLLPLVKLGYREFELASTGEILAFAGMRFFVCGAILTGFCFFRNRTDFAQLKKSLPAVLLMGLFGIILHYSFSYLGLRMTDGSKTGILKQMGSVFFICCSPLFFPDDKLTRNKLIGLLLSFSGILVINLRSGGFTFHFGDILLLTSSFCTVFSNVLGKKVFRKVEPILAAGVSQFFGGVVLLLVGMALGCKFTQVVPVTLPQMGILGTIFASSIISYTIWYLSVQKESLSRLYVVKFAEPLCALVFSWILLGENIFQLRYAAAFLLISSGILIANKRRDQEKTAVK